jgi:hypothetical protein
VDAIEVHHGHFPLPDISIEFDMKEVAYSADDIAGGGVLFFFCR